MTNHLVLAQPLFAEDVDDPEQMDRWREVAVDDLQTRAQAEDYSVVGEPELTLVGDVRYPRYTEDGETVEWPIKAWLHARIEVTA